MSDIEILALFKTGKREKAFKKVYKLYPKIEALIKSKGGSKSDASDVFQEALIILNRNLESPDFKLTSSFYTYLYSVSRFVWSDIQKKTNQYELSELSNHELQILDDVKKEARYKQAELAFKNIGERCQNLLKLFYHKKMSFKTIADLMQFKSAKIAKNQKYKCLKKAKANYQSQTKAVKS